MDLGDSGKPLSFMSFGVNMSKFTLGKSPVTDDIKPDMGHCSDCGKGYRTTDMVLDHDFHDGHEMPAYGIHQCPECPDGGCVDNYFLSPTLQKEWEDSQVEDCVGLPHNCPQCIAVSYTRMELQKTFGTRVVNNRRIAQSWCRTCRSEERKNKRGE